MAQSFDRIKLNDGMVVTVSDDKTIIKTEVGGRTYNFDISKASSKEISDFMAGVGYGRAVNSNLVMSNPSEHETNINSGVGRQDTNKIKTLTTSHYKSDIDSKISMPYQNPNGFISKILITSLSGFMIGTLIAIIYICINLGKITFSL